jgi:hypothetical protein
MRHASVAPPGNDEKGFQPNEDYQDRGDLCSIA